MARRNKGRSSHQYNSTMPLYNTISDVMNMFVDRTVGESTQQNRLTTQETEDGNVALVGYGWQKLAEYDEERGVVTIFTGHRAMESDTTNRWLEQIKNVADERGRNKVMNTDSPIVGPVPDCVTYVGDYINFRPPRSSVEQNAVDAVVDSLRGVAA